MIIKEINIELTSAKNGIKKQNMPLRDILR